MMLPSRHLDDIDFLVIDVETTGLSAGRGDRICEIGAVKLRGGTVLDSFGSLVNPERPVSPGAYAVNRISRAMLSGAPLFGEIAGRLRSLMEASVVVAYNAGFDLSFVESEFALAGLRRPPAGIVDALGLARRLLPGLRKYHQEHVAALVGIPFPVKHRALEDAVVTAKLFTLFTTILKAHGCSSFDDLSRHDLTAALCAKRRTIVDHALATHSRLWIRHVSPADGGITHQVVTPRGWASREAGCPAGGIPTLIAYCHSTESERHFPLDRILDLRLIHPIAR